jgi:hypothetical protein
MHGVDISDAAGVEIIRFSTEYENALSPCGETMLYALFLILPMS